jgi:Asp-tRNA(Asn)/Glu-tRNA(Gln) amidotransferase A subunit family amidase
MSDGHSDLPLLSASELARLIERKEVSPVEVTDAYLQRVVFQKWRWRFL